MTSVPDEEAALAVHVAPATDGTSVLRSADAQASLGPAEPA